MGSSAQNVHQYEVTLPGKFTRELTAILSHAFCTRALSKCSVAVAVILSRAHAVKMAADEFKVHHTQGEPWKRRITSNVCTLRGSVHNCDFHVVAGCSNATNQSSTQKQCALLTCSCDLRLSANRQAEFDSSLISRCPVNHDYDLPTQTATLHLNQHQESRAAGYNLNSIGMLRFQMGRLTRTSYALRGFVCKLCLAFHCELRRRK